MATIAVASPIGANSRTDANGCGSKRLAFGCRVLTLICEGRSSTSSLLRGDGDRDLSRSSGGWARGAYLPIGVDRERVGSRPPEHHLGGARKAAAEDDHISSSANRSTGGMQFAHYRRRRPATRSQDDITKALDQFSKCLLAVAHEEGDQVVKEVRRPAGGVRLSVDRQDPGLEDQHRDQAQGCTYQWAGEVPVFQVGVPITTVIEHPTQRNQYSTKSTKPRHSDRHGAERLWDLERKLGTQRCHVDESQREKKDEIDELDPEDESQPTGAIACRNDD